MTPKLRAVQIVCQRGIKKEGKNHDTAAFRLRKWYT